MEDLDKRASKNSLSDEELLLKEVIQGDAELLFLEYYLSELFRAR